MVRLLLCLSGITEEFIAVGCAALLDLLPFQGLAAGM